MSAGQFAKTQAAVNQEKSEQLESMSLRRKALAEQQSKTAEAQMLVAKELAKLVEEGYTVMHDRKIKGTTSIVPHIALGPSGLYLLYSKPGTDIEVKTGIFYSDGKRTKVFQRVNEDLTLLRNAMQVFDLDRIKNAIVSVEGFDSSAGSAPVVSLKKLNALIVSRPRVLSREDISSLTASVLEHTFPAGVVLPKPTAEDIKILAETDLECSYEDLNNHYVRLYVNHWSRGNVLYFKDPYGLEVANKSLKTGKVTHAKERSENNRMLEALVTIDSFNDLTNLSIPAIFDRGSKTQRLKAAFQRRVQHLLVGWHWCKGDAEMLYVHAIEPKQLTRKLGHVNLKTGEVIPLHKSNKDEALIRYVWEGFKKK